VYFHKMNNRSNLQIIFNECDFRGIFISWDESCCNVNNLSKYPAHKGYVNSLSQTIDNTMEELSEEGSSLVYFGFDRITRNVMKNVGYTIESIFKNNGYEVTWDETMKTKIGVVITEIDLPVGFRNGWVHDSHKKEETRILTIKNANRKIDTFIDSDRSDSDDQYTSSEYDFSYISDNGETVEDFLTDIRKDIYNLTPTTSNKYLEQDCLHSLSSSGGEQNYNRENYKSEPDIVKTEYTEETSKKTIKEYQKETNSCDEERDDCSDIVCPEDCDCVNCEAERDDCNDIVCPEDCDCVNCEAERDDCNDIVCPEDCDCVNCEAERDDCNDIVCTEDCDCVNCEAERDDCNDIVCTEDCDCVNCEAERDE
jgi:hypothetical protein